jgi:hypothetical protein
MLPPSALVRRPNLPNRKFNLTVGERPPILNDRREAIRRALIDNLAGFAASRVNGQSKCLWLFARNLDRQIAVENEHSDLQVD